MVSSGKSVVIRGNTAPANYQVRYVATEREKQKSKLRVVRPGDQHAAQAAEPKKQAAKKQHRAAAPALHPLRLLRRIALVAGCFAVAMLMVHRYSMIAGNNVAIENLRAQLHEANRQIEQLEVDLSLKQSLNEVMRTASVDLNMGNPQPHQIVSVALNDPSVQAAAGGDEQSVQRSWLGNMLAQVIGILE